MNYIITIYNILMELGLSPSLKGTKLLIQAIQIVVNSNNEFIIFENVYKNIANKYDNLNSTQIRNSIKYAIDNREDQKSITNFKKIFGYDYNKYYFTNKNIIEEISRIIKYEYSK